MWLSAGAIGHLVDAAAQVCERLHPVGRWMLDYATGFEAENLRHPRANEIGNDDEAGVVKAAHKEVDTRHARYGLRPPWLLLARWSREGEAGQGRADAPIRSVSIEPPRYGVLQGRVRPIAQRDYVVGRSAEKPDSGAQQWNGDVIGCAGKGPSALTPASRQKTKPICREKIFCWRILQSIALQVENV